MTTKTITIAMLTLTLLSCENNRQTQAAEKDIPKALDDRETYYESVKRQPDLVESLYSELVSKDVKLKDLQAQLNNLSKQRTAATDSFDRFDEKNGAYFRSADQHIASIQDSQLRYQLGILLTSSSTKYAALTSKHSDLIKNINSNQIKISDLHSALKIIRTLPLIEKYQQENLSGTKTLTDYIRLQTRTIQSTDTLVKQ